jgi:hypothetical protein
MTVKRFLFELWAVLALKPAIGFFGGVILSGLLFAVGSFFPGFCK